MKALQENGLRIDTLDGSQDIVLPSINVTNDCQSVGIVDLIILCVKSFDVEEAIHQMHPMVGPDTAILPIQNGIDHIETMKRISGEKHALGGSTTIGAYLVSPGHVRLFTPTIELFFGEVDGQDSPRCHVIQEILQVEGITAVFDPAIIEKMWWKMAAMSALFGVFSLARVKAVDIRKTAELFGLVLQTAQESIAVANANNIPLTTELIQVIEDALNILPDDWQPSMALALENGQRLELEQVNGAICRYGRKAHVPTPINDVIYACLKPYEMGR